MSTRATSRRNGSSAGARTRRCWSASSPPAADRARGLRPIASTARPATPFDTSPGTAEAAGSVRPRFFTRAIGRTKWASSIGRARRPGSAASSRRRAGQDRDAEAGAHHRHGGHHVGRLAGDDAAPCGLRMKAASTTARTLVPSEVRTSGKLGEVADRIRLAPADRVAAREDQAEPVACRAGRPRARARPELAAGEADVDAPRRRPRVDVAGDRVADHEAQCRLASRARCGSGRAAGCAANDGSAAMRTVPGWCRRARARPGPRSRDRRAASAARQQLAADAGRLDAAAVAVEQAAAEGSSSFLICTVRAGCDRLQLRRGPGEAARVARR